MAKVLHSAPGLPEELISEVEQHKASPGAGARFIKSNLISCGNQPSMRPEKIL